MDDPSERILEVPLLTEAERAQALDEWAGGSAEFAPATLHGRFEEQVARTPDAPAVVFEDTTLSLPRAERAREPAGAPAPAARRRSGRPRRALRRPLARAGRRHPRDPQGGRRVPPPRSRVSTRPARASCSRTPPSRIVVGGAEQLASVELDEIETVSARRRKRPSSAEPTGDPDSRARPSDLAYVIYTSGSTGQPEGRPDLARERRRACSTPPTTGSASTPRDVWTLFHSFAFDFSVWELWGALLYGGRLVVVPYWVSRSPEAFHELLRRARA